MDYKLRPHQQVAVDAAVEYFHSKRTDKVVLVEPTGCHAPGYEVLMYDGSLRKVEDVQVGDLLMGPDSQPREVLKLHSGESEMHRITLRNKQYLDVNTDHILWLDRTQCEKSKEHLYPEKLAISVRDYLLLAKSRKHLYKFKKAGIIQYEGKNEILPIDPYFLGLWLGDGSAANTVITTPDNVIEKWLYSHAEDIGLKTNSRWVNAKNCWTVSTVRRTGRDINHLQKNLIRLNLRNNKHIPFKYLTTSEEYRWKLLSGIIDSDGSLSKGRYEVTFKQEEMAHQLFQLVNSLGLFGAINIKYNRCNNCKDKRLRKYYRVSFRGGEGIKCLVPNKKWNSYKYTTNGSRYGFTVESIGRGKYYGFELDGDHLFLDSMHNIIHNSGKSIIAAKIAELCKVKTIISAPRKELVKQNLEKFESFGYTAGVYCASLNRKELDKDVVFATPQSLKAIAPDLVGKGFKMLIMDECGRGSKKKSMVDNIIKAAKIKKVIGLTATPLETRYIWNQACLSMITRSRENIFNKILNVTQIQYLVKMGWWAPIIYDSREVDYTALEAVSGKAVQGDYSEDQLNEYFAQNRLSERILQAIDDNPDRKSIAIFVPSISYGQELADIIPNSAMIYSGMKMKDRDFIIESYKTGVLRTIVNVDILGMGFDHRPMDLGIMARPSRSLTVYYQQAGRLVRPYHGANDWDPIPEFPDPKLNAKIIDFSGNVENFGALEDLKFVHTQKGHWDLFSKNILMTNAQTIGMPGGKGKCMFGKLHYGKPMDQVPTGYLLWMYKNVIPKDENDMATYVAAVAILKEKKIIK